MDFKKRREGFSPYPSREASDRDESDRLLADILQGVKTLLQEHERAVTPDRCDPANMSQQPFAQVLAGLSADLGNNLLMELHLANWCGRDPVMKLLWACYKLRDHPEHLADTVFVTELETLLHAIFPEEAHLSDDPEKMLDLMRHLLTSPYLFMEAPPDDPAHG